MLLLMAMPTKCKCAYTHTLAHFSYSSCIGYKWGRGGEGTRWRLEAALTLPLTCIIHPHAQKRSPDFMFSISYVNDTKIYAFCFCDKKRALERWREKGGGREWQRGRVGDLLKWNVCKLNIMGIAEPSEYEITGHTREPNDTVNSQKYTLYCCMMNFTIDGSVCGLVWFLIFALCHFVSLSHFWTYLNEYAAWFTANMCTTHAHICNVSSGTGTNVHFISIFHNLTHSFTYLSGFCECTLCKWALRMWN